MYDIVLELVEVLWRTRSGVAAEDVKRFVDTVAPKNTTGYSWNNVGVLVKIDIELRPTGGDSRREIIEVME